MFVKNDRKKTRILNRTCRTLAKIAPTTSSMKSVTYAKFYKMLTNAKLFYNADSRKKSNLNALIFLDNFSKDLVKTYHV
jgi:hypothetical protein